MENVEGVSGGEGRRGVGVKREGRVRMLEAEWTIKTGSVISDCDDVTF